MTLSYQNTSFMKKVCILIVLLFNILSIRLAVAQKVQLGADQLDQLVPLLNGKKVALVVNQTSQLTDETHLLDALLLRDVNISKIFAPEHGFRGNADAGQKIVDGKDSKTGINVVSLYGKNNKPTAQQLTDVDVVVFDIQDVGARFYTYISTMHYVMEACAENNKQLIVLDRPNPNDYIDGPILDPKFRSFVGIHPIPILHGLTVGELANMINGEKWLKGDVICDLQVIPVKGWKHGDAYELPVKPSPNLSNNHAIYLYPSLCFFEATNISVGRGTEFPFEVIGGINKGYGNFRFTPRSIEGAKNPLLKDKACFGLDLRQTTLNRSGIDLSFLIDFYKKSNQGAVFFTSPKFMDLLSGTDKLRLQIIQGKTPEEIYASWAEGLEKYKMMRQKYLLYN